MPAHAQRQRAQPADQQPGIERRQLGAEIGEGQVVDPRQQGPAAGQRAGHHVAVAAEILGGRMQHQVDAVLDRALEDRRSPAVVDHRDDAGGAGQRRQPRQVLGLEHPAGRAFEIEQPRPGQRPGDRVGVAAIDELDGDAEARQHLQHHPVGVGIDMAHAQDAVAAAAQAEDGRADRPHAAGEATRRLGALQRRELALELGGRGIVDPRIDRVRALAAEARTQLVIAREGEQRALVDRRHDGAHRMRLVMGDDGPQPVRRRVARAMIVGHGPPLPGPLR